MTLTARLPDIVAAVCAEFDVPIDAIEGNSRCRRHCEPRFLVIVLALETGRSHAAIGRYFGRDHSTIINGRKRAEAWLERRETYREKMAGARARLADASRITESYRAMQAAAWDWEPPRRRVPLVLERPRRSDPLLEALRRAYPTRAPANV